MISNVKVLTIRFRNPLLQREIPFFRGAIIHTVGEKSSDYFHNHEGESLRYRYPFIQYKRIGGNAALVCVGEGTGAIGELFASCNFDVQIGRREVRLEVDTINASQTLVQVCEERLEYTLRKWLPLNQENYQAFQQLESLSDRCVFLEKMLTSNILSFAKGVSVTLDGAIDVKIRSIANEKLYLHKGVKMMGFDVEFSANVTLPDFIGIGKGVSMGFGMVKRKR